MLCESDIQSLRLAGLSLSQARVFLTLTIIGKSSINNVAKETKIDAANTYRAVGSLQKLGLIKKTIAVPNIYEAIPLQDAINILLEQKAAEYTSLEDATKKLLSKYNEGKTEKDFTEKNQFLMIPQKKIYANLSLSYWKNAKTSIDVISTVKRAMESWDFYFQAEKEALERGVKIRVLIETNKSQSLKEFSTEYLIKKCRKLYRKPNWENRLTSNSLDVIGTIFDKEVATFIVNPKANYTESPSLVTNHHGFLVMFQNYFDTVWNSTADIPIQTIIMTAKKTV
jgi:sugar-specific transcriptional regulator TrmB